MEEERLRQEAIKEAEERRRIKHKRMEEERETMRQGIREKVALAQEMHLVKQPIRVFLLILHAV